MILSLKDYRDVWNKHFVILLHNIKGINAVLSRIWKCSKSRSFGAIFFGQKIRLVLYFTLFATMDPSQNCWYMTTVSVVDTCVGHEYDNDFDYDDANVDNDDIDYGKHYT